jgi:hypothetical protein
MAAKKTVEERQTGREIVPSLIPGAGRPQEQPEGEGEPCDQACYEFNETLPAASDDRKCRSCRKYLTTICEQIAHFLDEDGDVD